MNELVVSCVFVLLFLAPIIVSQSIIKTLPGFSGDLPFKLETGYIGVGELDVKQLFYYFIESERSPKDDPLVLWMTGGPGCSGFSGLVYEIGPIQFDYKKSTSDAPVLVLNPYSWTKVANIIFIDAPAGTGFSYATVNEAYYTSDSEEGVLDYEFLRKWLLMHPKFQSNNLYIAGDSYGGHIVPLIVQQIIYGIERGDQPRMYLKGYAIGNPVTDLDKDKNARIEFADLKGLISDQLYQSAKKNCKGNYIKHINYSNPECVNDLARITECIENIFTANILEPTCKFEVNSLRPKPMKFLERDGSVFWEEDHIQLLSSGNPHIPEPWCRNYHYLYSSIWIGKEPVRKALDIREGTKTSWVRCNESVSEEAYNMDISSVVGVHRNLTTQHLSVLVYSGDHDMVIPYLATYDWILSLNLTQSIDWKPWFVDGEVAGYKSKFSEGDYDQYELVFATVKGGGHTATEYKPKQCLAMIERWFATYPL